MSAWPVPEFLRTGAGNDQIVVVDAHLDFGVADVDHERSVGSLDPEDRADEFGDVREPARLGGPDPGQ
jgi:hypothetical protein